MFEKSIKQPMFAAVFLLAAVIGYSGVASAQEDTQGPVLTSFDFNPKVIDTTSSDQQISVSLTTTDDLSGTQSVNISFDGPVSRNCTVSGGSGGCSITIPQYSPAGTFTVHATTRDNVGNTHYYSTSELGSLGFPNVMVNEGLSDTLGPVLISFDFNPKVIDTTNSDQYVNITLSTTDDLSGTQSVNVSFDGPVSRNCTAGSGTSGCTVTIPRYSPAGTFTVHATTRDNVGNTHYYSTSELGSLGFPNGMVNEGQSDTQGPVLTSFDFNPKVINTTDSDQYVSVSLSTTDDLSGTQSVNVSFDGPVSRNCTAGSGSSGCTIMIPRYAPAGTFTVHATTRDNVGNTHYYSTSELGSLGFPNGLISRANSSPVLTSIGEKVIDEGQPLSFAVTATDPDAGDVVTLGARNLPTGATFDAATGAFSWTPTFEQAGTYTVTFIGTDNGNPVGSTTQDVVITVTNVNRAPEMATIGDQQVDEGQLLTVTLSATDPDGDALTYAAANLPSGATFDPQTATLSWTPTFGQAGNYSNVEFTVTDSGSPLALDVELITITVADINRAPVFTPTEPQAVLENQSVTFTVAATDPDNDTVTLTAADVPTGATFNAQTGTFTWTPTLSQSGNYTVTFTATDSGNPTLAATLIVPITVGDNPTPEERADTLVDTVVTYDLPTNIENAYLANLKKVEKFIAEGKINPAIGQLNAFITKLTDDYAAGRITQGVHDDLWAQAHALLAVLQ